MCRDYLVVWNHNVSSATSLVTRRNPLQDARYDLPNSVGSMKGVYDCKVAAHTYEAPDVYRLILSCSEIACQAQPGQFVNVRVSSTTDPLLRRPFSIQAAHPDEGTFSLLYVVRGRATKLLAGVGPGETLSVVGPLGRPFNVDCPNDAVHILVAGGCGVAPLHFLCASLISRFGPDRVIVLAGAQTKESVLCEGDFRSLGANIRVCTDDGTYGTKGVVTDLLWDILSDTPSDVKSSRVRVYACGPREMLREVARICREARVESCQVSLENFMACGLGVCLGCVQKLRRQTCPGTDDWHYERVCTEGPVFEASEVIWD